MPQALSARQFQRLAESLVEFAAAHGLDELADRAMLFHRMSQGLRCVDPITVSATFTLPAQHVGLLEIEDYSLDGSFRDADLLCHVAQPHVRVVCETDQDVAVVAQQGPMTAIFHRLFVAQLAG